MPLIINQIAAVRFVGRAEEMVEAALEDFCDRRIAGDVAAEFAVGAVGAHHHGHLESIIYVVKGKARMRWGEHLQFTAEANPGDFIFIPPYVPHQEINASRDEVLECVLVRSDGQAVAINLDIEPVEKPETVLWVDPVHPAPETK